jgi:hypothetical protein
MDARVSPRRRGKNVSISQEFALKPEPALPMRKPAAFPLVAPKRLDLSLDRALVDYAHRASPMFSLINRAAAARNAVGVGLGERWRRKNYDNIGAMASIVGNAIEGRAVAAITANQRFG